MNKIIVLGPAASDLAAFSRLKFCIVKHESEFVLLLFCAKKPLMYHNDAVQFYMGNDDIREGTFDYNEGIVVCGGGQLDFDYDKETITVFEGSKAFGWSNKDMVTSLLKEFWSEYEVIFVNDQDALPPEEKTAAFDFDAYKEIVNNEIPKHAVVR